MLANLSSVDTAKYAAAKRAAELVQNGMRVGLGTGSTSAWLVHCLRDKMRRDGLRFTAVPTSDRTEVLAREAGLKVKSLEDAGWLDLTIDGAGQFDSQLNLIKGGGGALLREKIAATASDQMVVIADAGKQVGTLGSFPLPVEVLRYGWITSRTLIREALICSDVLGRDITMRMQGAQPFLTDEGNMILDLHLKDIGDPRELARVLNQIPGVVENGLFLDICDKVVVGYGDGRVEIRDINEGTIERGRHKFVDERNLFADLDG